MSKNKNEFNGIQFEQFYWCVDSMERNISYIRIYLPINIIIWFMIYFVNLSLHNVCSLVGHYDYVQKMPICQVNRTTCNTNSRNIPSFEMKCQMYNWVIHSFSYLFLSWTEIFVKFHGIDGFSIFSFQSPFAMITTIGLILISFFECFPFRCGRHSTFR